MKNSMMNTGISDTNRAKVTNGSQYYLEGRRVDARTELARRIRDHYQLLRSELAEAPRDSQDALLRRAAAFATLCELHETDLAAGEDVDTGRYLQVSKELRACLVQLGIARPTRSLTKAESKAGDLLADAMAALDDDG